MSSLAFFSFVMRPIDSVSTRLITINNTITRIDKSIRSFEDHGLNQPLYWHKSVKKTAPPNMYTKNNPIENDLSKEWPSL